jgi:DNA-binding CsgD family transcriptional regulator
MTQWRADAALALAALGDVDEARLVAAAGVEAAQRWGDPWLVAQALRALALVEPPEERLPRLEEAEALLRPSEARLELARTLAEVGAAQRASGDDAKARETLREALDLATRCGSPALSERVREELIQAGGRPRRAVRMGPAALTPTEERVARMAAEGPTNREIAQALFVTEKTVEAHLASAYRKLGIRGRGQLGEVLSPESGAERFGYAPDG